MRVAFFGTPEFAVPTLRRLAGAGVDIALVVTQPDRPAGRGRRVERSAVGQAAEDLQLPLYQPASLRDPAARQPLVEAQADLFVVAAYGLIFGAKTLALPRLGCVNVHASLLPRYRGASPVAAAILAGDATTGVTLMRMEPGLDTGPILAAAEARIDPAETTASLTRRLAELGADLATETLPSYAEGLIPPRPQPTEGASLTRPLTKADGRVRWDRPAPEVERHVRAMWPWPRAACSFFGTMVQIQRSSTVVVPGKAPAGTVLRIAPELVVAAGEGAIRLDEVQPAGGRTMTGADFARGRRLQVGHRADEPEKGEAIPPLLVPVR
ncbi:MAG: methionyl-tRNA formyltransferase [Chloroflexota bacterium]|nr:methionyl-tRNA formyltransferase [Chloroflexota bacterium]